jgi:plastocyanin
VKKLFALLAAGALIAAFAVPALAVTTKTITIGDNYFVRKGPQPTVTIRSGNAVKFVWRGKSRHQVYQLSGPIDGAHFHTPTRTRGSYTRVFHKRGTYQLFCTVHLSMKMTLKVK